MRLTPAAILTCVAAVGAMAHNPAAIGHHLRYGVRIADQADISLELTDRTKSYHVPGLSIAVIDDAAVDAAAGRHVPEHI